jgi:hypothetical protein
MVITVFNLTDYLHDEGNDMEPRSLWRSFKSRSISFSLFLWDFLFINVCRTSEVKVVFFYTFLPQINMIEEPLVNMEMVSNETDPLLFRYSKAAAANQSQDVFPATWRDVQVRTAD